jgi:8-oxo-dGTP pyrophosphatase MutT (NUDIX family)
MGEGRVSDFEIFRVRRHLSRSPRTGETHPFTIVETTDWVNVIALTPSDEVVLIRQYRHGSDSVTLEIPGGVVDPGEEPSIAAVRELREETGFAGSDPVFLGSVHPNPALLTNRCHTYLVRDCERVAEPSPDASEDIEALLLPCAEIPAAIGDGRISHALVICAFWWLREWSRDGKERDPSIRF